MRLESLTCLTIAFESGETETLSLSMLNRTVQTAVNFINILRAYFSYKILVPKLQTQITACNFWRQNFVQKRSHKTLMKLTPDVTIGITTALSIATLDTFARYCKKR